MKPLTLPQLSSRVTHTEGAGGDGKGEERKTRGSLSLSFLLPITPRAPLGRVFLETTGTSQIKPCQT